MRHQSLARTAKDKIQFKKVLTISIIAAFLLTQANLGFAQVPPPGGAPQDQAMKPQAPEISAKKAEEKQAQASNSGQVQSPAAPTQDFFKSDSISPVSEKEAVEAVAKEEVAKKELAAERTAKLNAPSLSAKTAPVELTRPEPEVMDAPVLVDIPVNAVPVREARVINPIPVTAVEAPEKALENQAREILGDKITAGAIVKIEGLKTRADGSKEFSVNVAPKENSGGVISANLSQGPREVKPQVNNIVEKNRDGKVIKESKFNRDRIGGVSRETTETFNDSGKAIGQEKIIYRDGAPISLSRSTFHPNGRINTQENLTLSGGNKVRSNLRVYDQKGRRVKNTTKDELRAFNDVVKAARK